MYVGAPSTVIVSVTALDSSDPDVFIAMGSEARPTSYIDSNWTSSK